MILRLGQRCQDAAYSFFRLLLNPYFTWRFGIKADPVPGLDEPYLVVANHVTELDFLFLGKMFKRPMGFVVGQNLLENPLMAFLLIRVFGCVPKQKGASDARTAAGMIRRARQGRNLCLFPEGDTCFDGCTGPFPLQTGPLIRLLKVRLVTVRIEGGYYSLPRWGKGIRRGQVRCRLMGSYAAQELGRMTGEEVNALLQRDLATDAVQEQQAQPQAFHGKNPAHGLEHALYCCPGCQKTGTLKGSQDRLSCQACGMHTRYLPDGSFENAHPFAHIKAWVAWQKQELKQRLALPTPAPLLQDSSPQALYDFNGKLALKGPVRMDREALLVGELSFPLSQIKTLSIFRKNTLLIALKSGKFYQIKPAFGFNALKYRDLFSLLQEEKE